MSFLLEVRAMRRDAMPSALTSAIRLPAHYFVATLFS